MAEKQNDRYQQVLYGLRHRTSKSPTPGALEGNTSPDSGYGTNSRDGTPMREGVQHDASMKAMEKELQRVKEENAKLHEKLQKDVPAERNKQQVSAKEDCDAQAAQNPAREEGGAGSGGDKPAQPSQVDSQTKKPFDASGEEEL